MSMPDPLHHRQGEARHSLPPGVRVLAGVLLAIPIIGLAIVPVYAKAAPKLWGFPFFYWYQFLWVFLASGFTFTAYLVISRARHQDGHR